MSRTVHLPDGTVMTGCFSVEHPSSAPQATSAPDRTPERLSLGQSRVPDVLECLANLSSDEVFTPPRIANEMLDLLPAEVWTDPTLRWLDPGCKSGVFLREAARRLMDGLKDVIPDEDARRRHIFTEMLHGYAITELTAMICRRSLYYTKDATSEEHAVVTMPRPEGNVRFDRGHHTFAGGSCSVCGAGESLERGEERENYAYAFIHERADAVDVQFDVVIGNPPYHLDGGNGARPTQIYHMFVESALKMKPRYVSMIIPARWFLMSGELAEFRRRLVGDGCLRSLRYYPNAADAFPDVEIKGGVCYFLWNRDKAGLCEFSVSEGGVTSGTVDRDISSGDVIVRFNESVTILEKVQLKAEATLDGQVSSEIPFGLSTNFDGFVANKRKTYLRLYKRGGSAWVAPSKIARNHQWLPMHKVLLPKAGDGSGVFPIQVIGKPVQVAPASACTQTYLVAGCYGTAQEAENLQFYLKTKFVRFLVSLRKSTQDTNRMSFKFVPELDMTVRWTDQMLYQRYGLTQDEIDFIESRIKEMA